MSDEPAKSVTVDELMPAVIEMGSIQHDLLTRLFGLLKTNFELQADTPINIFGRMDQIDQVLREISVLQMRNRDVLSWLLAKAKPTNER
jgi:hypothetical protein